MACLPLKIPFRTSLSLVCHVKCIHGGLALCILPVEVGTCRPHLVHFTWTSEHMRVSPYTFYMDKCIHEGLTLYILHGQMGTWRSHLVHFTWTNGHMRVSPCTFYLDKWAHVGLTLYSLHGQIYFS